MSFKNHLISITLVLSLLSPLSGGDITEKPVPISPGNGNELGLVKGLTPTFSWASVPWADAYRVAVFPGRDAGNLGYHDMAALANPVLFKEIPGGATSWTPSYGEKLAAGSLYVWFVQALDESGAGEWSVGGRFVVLEEAILGLPEEKLKETLWTAGVSPSEAEGLVRDVKSGLTPDVPAGDSPNETSKPLGSEGDTSHNTYYGTGTADFLTTSAYYNSIFGANSGYKLETGDSNTIVGFESGWWNETGNNNTCIGAWAGYMTTASYNTFIGQGSGYSNLTGTKNAYLGLGSGYSATGSSNVSLGYQAGYQSSGSSNVFMGYKAGYYETGSNRLYIENSNSSSPLIYGEFDNDLVRINGNFQATGYLSLNAGTNQITYSELNILDGKTLATGSANNDQLVTKGYVDENDDVGGGLTGSALTNRVIPRWDDAGNQLVDSMIGEGSGFLSINGNLGVGIVAPEFTIHAQTTGENCMLVLDRTDGASFKLATVTNKVQIGCQSYHDVRFTSNNIARMVITKDGNVGINELSPTHLLQLGGGAYCDGGAWVAGSSRSLKTDIQSLDGGEAEAAVMNLRPVKFRYKANTAEEYLGFIAEDVPELVAMNGRRGMTAMDVVAALTKVVQKQQGTIRAQEKTNQDQQQLIQNQDKTLKDLQRLVLEQAKAIQVQQEDLRELKARVENPDTL